MREPAAHRVEIYRGCEIDVALSGKSQDWFVRVMITPERFDGLQRTVPVLNWDVGHFVGDMESAFEVAFAGARAHLDAFPNIVRTSYRKDGMILIPGAQLMNDRRYRPTVQTNEFFQDGRLGEPVLRDFDVFFDSEEEAEAYAVAFIEGRA